MCVSQPTLDSIETSQGDEARIDLTRLESWHERVKLSYVHSRLFNEAAEITQARREHDCAHFYRIVEDLLKELAQLFNDSNKKVNFRRKYYNLIQEFKKFNEFYTQFQRLSFYLDYHEKQLIIDLKDKINSRLQFIWIN